MADHSGPDAPGFIIRCVDCGEDFDILQAAVDHIMDGMADDEGCNEDTTFMILPDEMSNRDD
jgi:predicted nucleic acid-binding Zn ribbon protein